VVKIGDGGHGGKNEEKRTVTVFDFSAFLS
jgi:hypothetical protein